MVPKMPESFSLYIYRASTEGKYGKPTIGTANTVMGLALKLIKSDVDVIEIRITDVMDFMCFQWTAEHGLIHPSSLLEEDPEFWRPR
jgi:hypothetical protein